MHKIINIALWEVKQALRNRVFLISMFIIPLVFRLFLLPSVEAENNSLNGTVFIAVLDQNGIIGTVTPPSPEATDPVRSPLYFLNIYKKTIPFKENIEAGLAQLRANEQLHGLLIMSKEHGTELVLSDRIAGKAVEIKASVMQALTAHLNPGLDEILTPLRNSETRILSGGRLFMEQYFANSLLMGMMLILLFFAVTSMAGNWFIRGFAEEKGNRLIEVLLCSVSLRVLLSGKFLGLIMVSLLQNSVIILLLLFLPGSNASVLGNIAQPGFTLLFFMLGLLQFLLVYLFIGLKSKTDLGGQSLGIVLGFFALLPLPLYLSGLTFTGGMVLIVLQCIPLVGPVFTLSAMQNPGTDAGNAIAFCVLHCIYILKMFYFFSRQPFALGSKQSDD
ncbi:MAG: ABC transporter permease [Ignavibacteriales bacterium]|nr:ABC transporter permease [Ignavibacteriales bacterium]